MFKNISGDYGNRIRVYCYIALYHLSYIPKNKKYSEDDWS